MYSYVHKYSKFVVSFSYTHLFHLRTVSSQNTSTFRWVRISIYVCLPSRTRLWEYKYVQFVSNFQARSCLYASTQLNPHYFDKMDFRWSRKLSGGPKTHQIAPFISKFSGMPPDPPRLFWIHIRYRLATPLTSHIKLVCLFCLHQFCKCWSTLNNYTQL